MQEALVEGNRATRYAIGRDASVSKVIPRVDLELSEVGAWRLIHIDIGADAANMHNLREEINFRPGNNYVTPGRITQLWQGNQLWMSDTFSERSDHLAFVRTARGQVFMAGLGLGVCIDAVLAKPEVDHLTVLERDPDVIQLVGGQYLERHPTQRLTIIEANALVWHPGKQRFDTLWFDIWPTISTDNRLEMSRLHRRYSHWSNAGKWMDSWKRWEVDAQIDRDRRSYW